LQAFTDFYGNKRLAGDEYIIDKVISPVHIVDAHEELLKEQRIVVLTQNQYCQIRNPVGADGKLQYGKTLLKRGEDKFFVQPGEEINEGIKSIIVVTED
jgi:major vault protein